MKLQHVASGNNINEPVYAHFKESNEMMLELAQRRGFVLRVKENGSVGMSVYVENIDLKLANVSRIYNYH